MSMEMKEFLHSPNLRHCIRTLEALCGDISIVDHKDSESLCHGFEYRTIGNVNELDIKVLDDSFNKLSPKEIEEIKELYL